jgi:tetratricopeptide (TPR) repeat protein
VLAASAAAVALAAIGFHSLALAPISDGDEAWERQEYREALGYYERAIYWDPADAYVHYSIGWCRLALDDLTESLRAFDAAIGIDSDNALYQLDRVRPLVKMGRLTQARFQLARASRLDGADPETIDELHGDLSEAALEKVRRLLQAAELLDARSALAEARELERIDGAAVGELEAALRAAFLQRARLLMEVGRPADARVVLEQARGLGVDEDAVRELEARASEALLEAVRLERDAILLLGDGVREAGAPVERGAEGR